jgi:chromosome segregation ATPase
MHKKRAGAPQRDGSLEEEVQELKAELRDVKSVSQKCEEFRQLANPSLANIMEQMKQLSVQNSKMMSKLESIDAKVNTLEATVQELSTSNSISTQKSRSTKQKDPALTKKITGKFIPYL